jgi:hypothetical protein
MPSLNANHDDHVSKKPIRINPEYPEKPAT